MIRPATPEDTATLVGLARETAVFKPVEIVALREVLDDYHASNQALRHVCVVVEGEGGVLGFAYLAPEAMTDQSWSLWWVAVQPERQGRGLGMRLLQYAEETARAAGARVMFIDTSSLPHYEPTRRFYRKHGYDVAAVLADWYADGDDKVVFRKRLG
jgi:GNAT superfamily N-acetyltransferase